MRTTLTLDDDVATAFKARTRTRGTPFKAAVSEVVRKGLVTRDTPEPERESFRVAPAPRGFLPGIDPLELNQLVDELETEHFLRTTSPSAVFPVSPGATPSPDEPQSDRNPPRKSIHGHRDFS